MKNFFSFVVFTSLLVTGCHRGASQDAVKKTKMDMKEFEEDLVVPSALYKAIEGVFKPMALDPEGNAEKEGSEGGEKKEKPEGKPAKKDEVVENLLKKKPPLDPIPITVYLVEKTPGVLGGQNFELAYGAGGGILDYRGFIPESKDGTFYLKVKYEAELDPKDTHVFYLSDARVREVGGKPMGNGCSRYFDITTYWTSQMKGDGLMLNTVDSRHISVTAGTLFFVAPYRGKIRIAHLSVKDSRHRDLLCSGEKK